MKNKFSHVAVLMGGVGDEKEVSLNSGKACAKALSEANYKVSKIIVDNNLLEKIQNTKPDVCFNALHGKFGEDGTIQGFLNTLKIPYTHSGMASSCIAMNKLLTKSLLTDVTKNISDPITFPKNLELNQVDSSKILFPLVIKPISGGSSVGIKIIKNSLELEKYKIYLSNKNLMVEPFVGNKELTVTVLKNKPLTVTEIISKTRNTFYDYDAKYSENASLHKLPANIPKKIFNQALNWAIQAHKIIGCKGISRSDFRYDEFTNQLFMLEINTQPGMTKTSLAPEQAKFCDIDMSTLVDILIREATWEK